MKYEQRRSAIGPQKYLKMKRWEVLDPNDRQYTIWGAPIEYPPPPSSYPSPTPASFIID